MGVSSCPRRERGEKMNDLYLQFNKHRETGVNDFMNRYKFLIFFLFVIFSVGCSHKDTTPQDSLTPITVKTVKITAQPILIGKSYPGTVHPFQQVNLSTRLSGWVETINFSEGQSVTKGSVLLVLRNRDLQAKVTQAESNRKAAEVQYQNAQRDFQRIETLFNKGAATQKEMDDIRAAYVSAEAQYQSSLQMEQEAREMLQYSILKAPFDGVVSHKFVEVGDLANPGQTLMVIENTRQVKIRAKIPETEIGSLTTGTPVNVQIHPFTSDVFSGTLERIIPAGDPQSRQFDVEVMVQNPEGKLKSGMFARITVSGKGQNGLFVPRSALIRRGQLEGLFIVSRENKAHLRWVRSGREYGNQVEILSGLNPGELVVVTNVSQLRDGQLVEVSQ
ncbi:MAG: efflux RND transporter periplasmic adaptor subunit [Calditrichaeota bacterium]|nr:MAG: efflux RND transporter periplasmic adaptor subunit [Calditrichota bacterium]